MICVKRVIILAFDNVRKETHIEPIYNIFTQNASKCFYLNLKKSANAC